MHKYWIAQIRDTLLPRVAAQPATRLHGKVLASQLLSTRLMSAALISIIVAATAWVVSGIYARKGDLGEQTRRLQTDASLKP